ncbi:MAG: cobalt ECF transporter T component CbiQ [Calditrichia bacterium]
MKHEFLDHHREGNSLVHRANARLKLVMLLLFVLSVVSVPSRRFSAFILLCIIPLLLAILSGIPVSHFLSKIFKIYPLIFIMTFLLPFLPSGEKNLQIFSLRIWETGIFKFLMINLKAFLSIFMSVVIISTTDFSALLKGMEKMKIPSPILQILSFMYRFIFLLIDEGERMQMARQSRYIKLPLRLRLQTGARQIGVFFVRTFERGERVQQAMDARGFSGKIYLLNELHWRKTDSVFLAVFILMISIYLFYLGILGHLDFLL